VMRRERTYGNMAVVSSVLKSARKCGRVAY